MLALRGLLRRTVDLRHFLVVLVGLSTLAAVGLPVWFARPEVTLDRAVGLLAQDLRSAQAMALVSGQPVHVDLEPTGYTVRDKYGELLDNPRTDHPFERRWGRDAVFRGVQLTSLHLKDRSSRITFNGEGEAHAGGRIQLSFREAHRTLELDSPRGLIHVLGMGRRDP